MLRFTRSRSSIAGMGVVSMLIVSTVHAGVTPSPKTPAVLGELVHIERRVLTVKDTSGKRLKLKIDDRTTRVGKFYRGAYVQAWLLPNGRTQSIVAFRTNRDTERELSYSGTAGGPRRM